MGRNAEYRIDKLPQINIRRNKFYMEENWKATFNAGDIIPFYVDSDVYPGETYKFKHKFVLRMLTPIYPTMDVAYIDTYFFSANWRNLWANFKKFLGENETGKWAITQEFNVPQLTFGASGVYTCQKGSVANYMGIPIGTKNTSISSLPFRMYCKLYNEFFRDQNLIAPITWLTSDTTISYSSIAGAGNGGAPFKAARKADYFSTCLPDLQKGTAPTLPLGTKAPLKWSDTSLWGSSLPNTALKDLPFEVTQTVVGDGSGTPVGVKQTTVGDITTTENVYVTSNHQNAVYADLANATASTLSALRVQIATQHILEIGASYGTRYTELVRSLFGTVTSDTEQQRCVYLGGKRYQLNMNQVAQTSSTDTTSPQGNLAAFSLTVSNPDILFTKSFTEHTIIMGVLVVRYQQTYQQGIKRMWKRKSKLDMYFPQLAHLSNQPVYNYEIYCQGDTVTDDGGNIIDNQVFGYQERFAELRMKQNIICGELSSLYSTPLDSWHYGDKFNSLPGLNQTFIEVSKANIDRTLAVQNHDQFMMDSLLMIESIKPLPLFGIPGLEKL